MHALFRPLTPPEATFAYMHQLLDGNTQVATLVTLPFLVDVDRLQWAAARLRDLFWCLSVQIVEREDSLWFYPADDVTPLQTSVNPAGTPFSPDKALRDELLDVLPTGGALWRLRAVFELHARQTHILFSRNHAISDGYTSAIVLATLVELLEGASGGEPEMPLSLSAWKSLSDKETGMYRTQASGGVPVTYDFPEPTQLSQRGPGLTGLRLPAKAVPVLRAAARANACSINDLFAAALVRGFCRATGHDEMVLHTAASLRARAPGQAVTSTGCFITVIPNRMDAGHDGLLPLAGRCRVALRAGLDTWQPAENNHRAIRDAVERFSGSSGFPGIALTNLGPLPQRAKALLRACEYRTVVNRSAGNYGIVLHLSTLGEGLSGALAYPCGLLPAPIVATVKAHVENDITALYSVERTIVKEVAAMRLA